MQLKIALAQVNTTVGDFEGNAAKVIEYAGTAAGLGADLVVFPEMTLTGYPPLDLLDYPAFADASVRCLEKTATRVKGIAALIGFVDRVDNDRIKPLRNGVAFVADGAVVSRHHKHLLPTYDVFDEARYFGPAVTVQPCTLRGVCVGVTVCEDIWEPAHPDAGEDARFLPARALKKAGARLLINLSASPFHLGKLRLRMDNAAGIARKYDLPVCLANMVGGNDGLLFDGASFAMSAQGTPMALAPAFDEHLLILDFDGHAFAGGPKATPLEGDASVRKALQTGLRDYCSKTGFKTAVLGLSGGIDSAVTACIAAEALGPESVLGVAMPSKYSSNESLEDARLLADNLGIDFLVIPIQPAVDAFVSSLSQPFRRYPEDVTEENIQARCRGIILMALSNKLHHLVLATGNKSELSVGYCTLYGDMAGGLAVVGDLPKAMVYALARTINLDGGIIPDRILAKPPSAELRENQKDTDSLPPYEELDPVLSRLVEDRLSPSQLASSGVGAELADRVWKMITISEHKRKQSPVVLRVTTKAFGFGRRMPIAARMDLF